MKPYEIRGASLADEDQLLAVAQHLNTVNLPANRESIRGILEKSEQSFNGSIKEPLRREYVFVLRDVEQDRIIGTSMIISQLGNKDAPYIYVDVIDEERYSHTIDRHFRHTTLNIGYSFDGPTEIGGLVLLPEYRRVPERLGQFVSYVRFLYLKMHRPLFRDTLLAELLPPLEADGTSHLWEAWGRHFTGLSYAEADVLSKKNKEFIKGLFPEHPIYASLLSAKAQEVIGKVGHQTRGVEKLLRRIGFTYAKRVDPFDGGPHFTAPTDDVSLVKRSFAGKVIGRLPSADQEALGSDVSPGRDQEADAKSLRCVVAVELPQAPWFVAVLTTVVRGADDGILLDDDACEHLSLAPGAFAWCLPLD